MSIQGCLESLPALLRQFDECSAIGQGAQALLDASEAFVDACSAAAADKRPLYRQLAGRLQGDVMAAVKTLDHLGRLLLPAANPTEAAAGAGRAATGSAGLPSAPARTCLQAACCLIQGLTKLCSAVVTDMPMAGSSAMRLCEVAARLLCSAGRGFLADSTAAAECEPAGARTAPRRRAWFDAMEQLLTCREVLQLVGDVAHASQQQHRATVGLQASLPADAMLKWLVAAAAALMAGEHKEVDDPLAHDFMAVHPWDCLCWILQMFTSIQKADASTILSQDELQQLLTAVLHSMQLAVTRLRAEVDGSTSKSSDSAVSLTFQLTLNALLAIQRPQALLQALPRDAESASGRQLLQLTRELLQVLPLQQPAGVPADTHELVLYLGATLPPMLQVVFAGGPAVPTSGLEVERRRSSPAMSAWLLGLLPAAARIIRVLASPGAPHSPSADVGTAVQNWADSIANIDQQAQLQARGTDGTVHIEEWAATVSAGLGLLPCLADLVLQSAGQGRGACHQLCWNIMIVWGQLRNIEGTLLQDLSHASQNRATAQLQQRRRALWQAHTAGCRLVHWASKVASVEQRQQLPALGDVELMLWCIQPTFGSLCSLWGAAEAAGDKLEERHMQGACLAHWHALQVLAARLEHGDLLHWPDITRRLIGGIVHVATRVHGLCFEGELFRLLRRALEAVMMQVMFKGLARPENAVELASSVLLAARHSPAFTSRLLSQGLLPALFQLVWAGTSHEYKADTANKVAGLVLEALQGLCKEAAKLDSSTHPGAAPGSTPAPAGSASAAVTSVSTAAAAGQPDVVAAEVRAQLASASAQLLQQVGKAATCALDPVKSRLDLIERTVLPAAASLRAAWQAYWQLPGQQAALQLELAQAAASRSCAYLECSNLAGSLTSAAARAGQGRGKMCGACRAVHYCGTACSHADWRAGHKRACKALAAVRQQQQLLL